eukprot:Selendium_serpulae@DN4122_c0_g1_i1.p1
MILSSIFSGWCIFGWVSVAAVGLLAVFASAPVIEAIKDRSGDVRRFVKWSSDENLWLLGSASNKKITSRNRPINMSVVIPAFNETQRLPNVLKETVDFLKKREEASSSENDQLRKFSWEVIVVDDGSCDGTAEAVLQQVIGCKWDSDHIRVICLTTNRGKGFAVRMGMLASRGRLALMMDADGATRIADMLLLESAMAQTPLKDVSKNENAPPGVIVPFGPLPHNAPDVVFGSRKDLEDAAVAVRKWYRNLLMYGFHFFVTTVVGSKIRDTQCGFKLFSREAVCRVFPSLHLNHWAFDIEILIVSNLARFGVKEVSVNWQEIQGSKLNIVTASLQMARDIVMIRLLYALKVWTLASK